jgi:hypothetical protein
MAAPPGGGGGALVARPGWRTGALVRERAQVAGAPLAADPVPAAGAGAALPLGVAPALGVPLGVAPALGAPGEALAGPASPAGISARTSFSIWNPWPCLWITTGSADPSGRTRTAVSAATL